ncbi:MULTISPECIES: hypothetical protein [Pseudomonas]|uniref:Uncharacterized protein n=1 Tax=Pseudomonas eucalypticola TaxID=2599595 RepID=A0A7D5HTR3_9PSED|nr:MULTISPECIES: hypothetical protein [Pseudomonas]QKZ02551.1 hypothetical protein HWQ56_01580 [Pseudomonas eucalypticola]
MTVHEAHLPTRSDSWGAHQPTTVAHYQVLAEAEPDSLCRVLNLLAMQYLIPQDLRVVREEDLLSIELQVDGLSWHRAEVIGNKMRNLIYVLSVELRNPATLGVAANG